MRAFLTRGSVMLAVLFALAATGAFAAAAAIICHPDPAGTKTATRFKHAPLNTYVSFSHTPAGQDPDSDCTLGDALPGPSVHDPSVCVISTEELQSLVFCLGSGLSHLEADALRLYLEGESYEAMAKELGCDTKTIDNALQRVKRKILTHQRGRQVLL